MHSDAKRPPIRVLHVIESLGTGGMENGVVNLVNRHHPDRVEADVLCLRAKGVFAAKIDPEKLYYSDRVGSSIPRAMFAVNRACRKRAYHIVHSHSWAALVPAFLGSTLARTPGFVHGEHGTLFLDSAKRRLIQKTIFRMANRCLSVSESLRAEILVELNIDPRHFEVIRNGVDLDRFTAKAAASAMLRAELGVQEDTIIIGAVGRLVTVKDYPTLLAAFRQLCAATAVDCRLVFVGDGPEYDNLVRTASELEISEQVKFFGQRDDVADIIPGFDIFVLPSLHEGMSNTLLEAAASGVPAVASEIAANKETLVENQTGLLFAPGNAANLCCMLKTLTEDRILRRRMSDNALSYARKYLSIDRMVENYETFYANIAGGD